MIRDPFDARRNERRESSAPTTEPSPERKRRALKSPPALALGARLGDAGRPAAPTKAAVAEEVGHGTLARRGSAGEIAFAEDIDASTRAAIVEMWTNRLAGFHRRDLSRYLRDNDESTRLVKDGRPYSSRTFRRFTGVLFLLRGLGEVFGLTLSAELLDAYVSRQGRGFVTRGVLVLTLCGRLLRQSRLAMSIVTDGDRWRWSEAVDQRIPRPCWPYRLTSDPAGRIRFVRTAEPAD